LEQFWDGNLINGKMVDREFIFAIKHDPGVVGKAGAFDVNLAVSTNGMRRVGTKWLQALARSIRYLSRANKERSN
jgi:hypothetical protein